MKYLTLRFIIGRAGMGKTRTCLDEVREQLLVRPEGPPLILLVPEQATFQTEYALAAIPGMKGFIRAQVLSFRRLAYRVLQEVGGAARAHIGELGKRMVLRRLLEQRRGELKVFRRPAIQPGFSDTLAIALGGMKTYCISPEELATAVSILREQGGNSLLAGKLEDLCLLYDDLEAYLADRFIDPDDYLNLLADRLEMWQAVKGAEVWVDGFTGFTPQEYRVLAALIRGAYRVNVTLCVDINFLGSVVDETDLFYPVRETYDTLCKMAAEERIEVERPLALDDDGPCRFSSPAIAHLEKYFFRRPAPPLQVDVQGVTLAVAANPIAEVEGVAREITALCRDRGYRYHDIVILLRELDSYAHLIANVFADYDIPVFIDQKRPVLHHPLVELVRSAIEVAAGDWPYDSVFRFLKTDLVPLSRGEVDRLENYVLEHGIRGSRWVDGKPWEYRRRLTLEEDREATGRQVEELTEINCIRQQATLALGDFYRKFRQAGEVRSMTAALFNLLEQLDVFQQLKSWNQQAEEKGQLEAAREHAQVWGMLTALLDQVVEALGDEVLTPQEYVAVLDAGFESMRLGLIPPGLDQVVVGSLERSRSPEARAAFVMGVNDGVLPARFSGQGILSEGERERLQAIGLKLAPGARRKVFDEQYLVYIALTRSSERLYLTYPIADDEGGALMPSPVVARVKELLPDVEERVWPVEPNAAVPAGLEFVTNPRRTMSCLAVLLRQAKAGRPIDPLWWDVYSWFARGGRREQCTRVLSALFHSNREGRLPAGLSRALYGRTLKTSVSGIEKFRACPFAHFLSRGLRLQERAVFKLSAPDLGQFFHAALKLFGERVQADGQDWGSMDRNHIGKMTGEVVDLLAPRLQSEILLSTARRRYLTGRLKAVVRRAALVLAEHSRRGRFRPVGLELAFGPGGDIPAVVFTLSDGSEMVLTGRIDRIDAAQGEDGVYLRVIDYKSGRLTINLSDIYHGLKLQLLAYLDVALQYAGRLLGKQELQGAGAGSDQDLRYGQIPTGDTGLPGAVLYFRIDDPLVRTEGGIPDEEEL